MIADKNNLCGYNKLLQPLANKLRKEMTKAEACLWKYVLRTRQMKGYQFRRQRPVMDFIADFMCKELHLIIEVDGITHDNRFDKDKDREDKLGQAGFHVLRFTDEEVLTNIEGVMREIERIIERIEPPPSPPPEGDKEGSSPPPEGDKWVRYPPQRETRSKITTPEGTRRGLHPQRRTSE